MSMVSLRSPRLKLVLLSLMHFAIDGLCAYLAFAKLYPQNPNAVLIIFFGYNILAFVTQSPIGLIIDKYNRPKLFLAISMAMMVLGYALSGIVYFSLIMIGIGNSIFHVAGGKYVTDKSGNDISHLGVFVSTGAIGLVLGQRYLTIVSLPYIFFAILIVCGLLVIFLEDSETIAYNEMFDGQRYETLALSVIVMVVAIRSFVGKVASPIFELKEHTFLIMSIATALGKAMGGISSKLVGVRLTTYISMLLAAVCMTFGAANPYIFVIGIFAFNFSMPITLYYANILLKGHEGFAFGTLAAALTPGYFIAMAFSFSVPLRIVTAALCLVSMLVIILVSKRIKHHANCTDINNNY